MAAYVDSTGVTNLTADIKALADTTYPANTAVAEIYSSTFSYSVGDYCLKNGLLYKCNTAIGSGGEAWNSAHWTLTNVVSNFGTNTVPATANPLMDGTAAVGTSSKYAREDHVHPYDMDIKARQIMAPTAAVERVSGATKIVNPLWIDRGAVQYGCSFDQSTNKLYLYAFVCYSGDEATKTYFLIDKNSQAEPYELTLENAPTASLSSLNDKYDGARARSTVSTDPFTMDFRLCRVIYDENEQEIDRIYSEQYRYVVSNGTLTRTHVTTLPTTENDIVDLGLIQNTGSLDEKFNFAESDDLQVAPVTTEFYDNGLVFYIPDSAFENVSNGLALMAKRGDGVWYKVTTVYKANDMATKAYVDGAVADVAGDIPTKVSDLTNDSGFIAAPSANADEVIAYNGTTWVASKRMVILSYGSSTWTDFINAYNSNAVVYCRASSNSNPASGAQTRMAFMAYVNSATPTNVEFQYYRSVNSHSDSQQGDQVFIYKLDKTAGWSVTTRNSFTKIAAGAGLSSSYSSQTLTLTNDVIPATANPLMDGTAAVGSSAKYAKEDHVHPTDTSRQATLVSGTNIKTINNESLLGSGDISIAGDVHVGPNAPTDPKIKIWLDTDEQGMSGVSSVNGATGTVVLDADDVGAMSKWDLLWTNASPSSSFAAQTVSLDLSGYDAVLLIAVYNADYNTVLAPVFLTLGETGQFVHIGTNGKVGSRDVTATATGIQFATNYYNAATDNFFGIPLKVYGIKGVQTT